MKRNKKGFTLVELLVVILIIGVLAAIALPMYQKAVKRSRFSALMPIAKALNEGNEHYYLNHSVYSTDPAELDIAGKDEYDDDTEVFLVNEDGFSYVMAYNEDRLPDNKYIAFQKHSDRFADTTMCEAADEAAGQICESFGGISLEGGLTSGWTAYLLSGSSAGSNFCPVGATCNSQGEVTECPNGKTLKEGRCVTCDIANASACSTTSYTATSCASGYCMKNGACVTCDYSGDTMCTWDQCHQYSTFGGNSQCGFNGNCSNSSFSDQSTCNGHDRYPNYATCNNSTFSGESSCGENAKCEGINGRSTFTDNATCSGACYGSTFSGNAICMSTWGSGCSMDSAPAYRSIFTDNAVCAGKGCHTANYEGNACCAGSQCGTRHVRKCVYNSDTQTYDRVGYWDDPA